VTDSDFQARVDAILETECEPSEQVWAGLNSGMSREDLSLHFGYSLRYVDRLIADAAEHRLLAGTSYHVVNKVIGDFQVEVWSILLSLEPGSGRIYHAGKEAAALRAQALELHRSGVSQDGISRRLRLNSSTVRRLLILGVLDESAVHKLQRTMESPKTRSKSYRREIGSGNETHQKAKANQEQRIRRSSSPPTPLNSQEAARFRRRALRLHTDGHSMQEIQTQLAFGKRESRALLAVALVESGWTLEATGSYVGLSRERVRQLARESGVDVRKLKGTRRDATKRSLAQREDLIADWVKSHPGVTIDEIAAATGLDGLQTRDIPKNVAHLVLGARSAKQWTTAQYSKETILTAIRQAFEIRNPLSSMYSEEPRLPVSGPYYEKLRRSGQVDGPSDVRIIQVFGSWTAACKLAGVPSPPAARAEYTRRWTDEELVGFVATFLLVSNSSAIDTFDSWSREDEARPSSGTIRLQLRLTWSEAKDTALLMLRRQWTLQAPYRMNKAEAGAGSLSSSMQVSSTKKKYRSPKALARGFVDGVGMVAGKRYLLYASTFESDPVAEVDTTAPVDAPSGKTRWYIFVKPHQWSQMVADEIWATLWETPTEDSSAPSNSVCRDGWTCGVHVDVSSDDDGTEDLELLHQNYQVINTNDVVEQAVVGFYQFSLNSFWMKQGNLLVATVDCRDDYVFKVQIGPTEFGQELAQHFWDEFEGEGIEPSTVDVAKDGWRFSYECTSGE